MIIFHIIMLILSLIGMFVFANKLDKDENFNTPRNAICVGMVAVYSILVGMFTTLIFIQL